MFQATNNTKNTKLPRFVKISGPQYSHKTQILILEDDVFFRLGRLLGAKNAIFGLPVQFWIFWYAGCTGSGNVRYHAKIHVDFQNLTKICKILITIVTWVKSTRIWPSGCEVRAVWSSAPTASQKPYPLVISEKSSRLTSAGRTVQSGRIDFGPRLHRKYVRYEGHLCRNSEHHFLWEWL